MLYYGRQREICIGLALHLSNLFLCSKKNKFVRRVVYNTTYFLPAAVGTCYLLQASISHANLYVHICTSTIMQKIYCITEAVFLLFLERLIFNQALLSRIGSSYHTYTSEMLFEMYSMNFK